MAGRKLRSIADIADLAGVSKSTVSRALNDSPLIGAETKERILAIAKEHEFQPSCAARNLSLRSSRTIGFVTHAYAGDCCGITDPFSLEIMGGITKGLSSLGYDTLVVHVDPRDTEWAERCLDSGKVDGFILMTSTRKRRHIEHLLEIGAPFIAWGYGEGFCTVRGEDRRGGQLAGARLAAAGRRRIGFIGGPKYETEVQERCRGFAESLAASGLRLEPELVMYGDYSERSGREAAAALLERRGDLDALFACSDLMAIAAMRELASGGRSVPGDVAVIGYDDLNVASYVSPALTTVSQSIGRAGTILARDLAAFLEKKVVTTSIIPVELKTRDSG